MISDLFYDDYVNVYDVERRIEEIEGDEEYAEELSFLERFNEGMKDIYSEWEYGEGLIRDSYFEDYAQELAEDTGSIDASYQWPYTCIDWEWAAEILKQDYDAVYVEGIKYLILSN